MSDNAVVRITEKDIVWESSSSYDQNPLTMPKFNIHRGDYKAAVYVDPFPGYSHSASLVHQELAYVASRFPLPVPITVYLPVFDGLNRVNGCCFNGMGYEDDEKKWINTSIVFYGKRIPLHPGMTRYLMAHEYGHAVQKFLEIKAGILDEPSAKNPFIDAYCEVRQLEKENEKTKWHNSPQEVFANDFRILICRRETEFWPHIGIPRPSQVQGLQEWWLAQLETAVAEIVETKGEVSDQAGTSSSVI